MLLALAGSARGQTAYSYRYWYDDDLSTMQQGSAQGLTTIEADISRLAKGTVHALHVQGLDARDKWSAARTQYFCIIEKAAEIDTRSATARYWFDDDEDHAKTTSTVKGTINLDVSGLTPGIHTIYYMTFTASGRASAVRRAYFNIVEKREEVDTRSVTARYWFDDDEENAKTTSTVKGFINVDASQLDAGIHAVHFMTFNAKGMASAVRTQFFYKKDELQLATLSCRLWIDDEEDKTMTFSLTEDIVIEALNLAAGKHYLHVVILSATGEQLAEKTSTFEVDAQRTVTLKLTAPIATFSSEKGLDFGNMSGLRAYTATSFHRPTGDILMSRVNDVPAGEGLLLIGEPGTYEVPILQSYSFYANLLEGTREATVLSQTSDGYDNYILSFRDGEAGFFLADDGTSLAAGKAYLRIPTDETAGARRLRLRFDEMPDGVESPLEETEESATYKQGSTIVNLAGQRIAGSQMQKGIYIKDGKRVLVR